MAQKPETNGTCNEYEKAVVDRCYNELLPRWQGRRADSPAYSRDNCWTMMESIIVTLQPEIADEISH
jgi:hypothetical protein